MAMNDEVIAALEYTLKIVRHGRRVEAPYTEDDVIDVFQKRLASIHAGTVSIEPKAKRKT